MGMAGTPGVTDESAPDVVDGCTVGVADGVPAGAGDVAAGVATGVLVDDGNVQVVSGINVVIAKRGG